MTASNSFSGLKVLEHTSSIIYDHSVFLIHSILSRIFVCYTYLKRTLDKNIDSCSNRSVSLRQINLASRHHHHLLDKLFQSVMADYQSTSYQQRRLAHRPATRPASATATQTIRQTPLLRLRAEPEEPAADRRRIQWAEDVVDNEGMGKKKSKGRPQIAPYSLPS